MTAQILTQEYLHALFNYKIGELYWKISNNRKIKIGSIAGYVTSANYKSVKIFGKQHLNHRLIFLMHYGYLPNYIDHIDENPSNNKIENLRKVTQVQNLQNSKLSKNNTSGCKNVYWNKAAKKWQVYCRIGEKLRYFGVYDDLELADLVAQEVRDKYFGKYARHF